MTYTQAVTHEEWMRGSPLSTRLLPFKTTIPQPLPCFVSRLPGTKPHKDP